MIRLFLALGIALVSAAALVQIAEGPAPVIVRPWSHNLQSVAGGSQFLVVDGDTTIGWCDVPQHPQTLHGAERLAKNVTRANGRFQSTRDDVDVTWSHLCPE